MHLKKTREASPHTTTRMTTLPAIMSSSGIDKKKGGFYSIEAILAIHLTDALSTGVISLQISHKLRNRMRTYDPRKKTC